MSGELKMNETAAKLPAAATTIRTCGGVSRRPSPISPRGHSPAQCDQGSLGAQHQPRADRRHAGPDPLPGQDRRAGRAPHGQALGRDVASVTGKAVDRERHDHRADRQDRERPPFRRTVGVAEAGVGEMRVQLALDLIERLEKAPGRKRHDHADDRHQAQEHDEPLAAPSARRPARTPVPAEDRGLPYATQASGMGGCNWRARLGWFSPAAHAKSPTGT